MSFKTEHSKTLNRGSGTKRRSKRQCIPIVARLEDRGLLSAVGAAVAAAVRSSLHGPALNVGPRIAEVDAMTAQLARREALVAARAAWAIHFPGGSVNIHGRGTHVIFPGGSVRANRHGAIVTFPGGFVISGFGHTIVRFPGGFINV